MSTTLLLWTLIGCQYLQELRDDPVSVQWSGNVYAALAEQSDLAPLDDGAVTLTDVDGDVLEEGYQPFEDTPGFWRFDAAPENTEVGIRIEGTDLAPTVWRGRAPGGLAIWLSGALYARERVIYEDILDALGEDADALTQGEVVMLWGEPLNVDEDWATAEIAVTDGAGQDGTVRRLSITDEGELVDVSEDAPLELFIAAGLAPGAITLDINGVQTEYSALGGDVLSASFYDLGE